MKKNKLLLASTILATALGMNNLASAEVNYVKSGVIDGSTLVVKKTFPSYTDDKVLMPKADYTFKVEADSSANGIDEKSGLEIKQGILDKLETTKNVSYTNEVKPGNKEQSVNFDFSVVDFSNVGIYRYKVSEKNDGVKGVTYDTKKWTVDVYVVEKEGKFVPSYIVSTETGSDKKPIVFNNSFATTSLEVKKRVTGNAGDKTKDFKFKLLLKPNEHFIAGQKLPLMKISNGKQERLEVTIGVPFEFDLKDNEKIQLDKLPIGISYQVEEVSKNKDKYSTRATLQQGEGEARDYVLDSEQETNDSKDIIVVTNKRDTQVPTGVVGTLAPFAVLSIVAIGGVIYITKRKKA
ncbi:T antigen/fimbrial major structural protein Tee11 [Streptococcus pyogenes]|uniref:QVPTGV class sortase B protein-sorting domain-containing protein n=1 Tax=Streptococcus pyogenes TaxID=1314 RepID=UPI000DA304A7|nr:QVPTGV class sortase B protein-sorting domain-containing protein [Streptococcus pyogenes]SQG50489.1 T antigen/fimbrial major structural protein Tee11 [Streptococcus pyogenes]VGQ27454.1 T antigen/fimbrial major structural protein Tee11 [Streptococcus pyogenes]VGQ68009.1 T antigen/fimbrial major structural protein Tee11 [Streptococcus pyogenes]VGU47493.1 T antigen/fimbrial major structural protein Tee11 [Streptococcus pyogenes]VGU84580.1 T antigen/fimbrial major structural protein Tee11 [Stre